MQAGGSARRDPANRSRTRHGPRHRSGAVAVLALEYQVDLPVRLTRTPTSNHVRAHDGGVLREMTAPMGTVALRVDLVALQEIFRLAFAQCGQMAALRD